MADPPPEPTCPSGLFLQRFTMNGREYTTQTVLGVSDQSGEYFHPFFDATHNDSGGGVRPRPLTELRMIRLSAAIRSKPTWGLKFQDDAIRSKWKEEAQSQEIFGGKLSEKEVEYVLDELRAYEAQYDAYTGIQVSCSDTIWQSDSLISEELLSALIKDISILENIPEDKKDWHPQSNGQVLDIVHPSLYCLVYGRSLAFPFPPTSPDKRVDQLKPIPPPDVTKIAEQSMFAVSDKFSWIPADFSISEDGKEVSTLGYINNLHPSNLSLYRSLEKILAAFLPMFERVLTDVHVKTWNILSRPRTVGSYVYLDGHGQGYDPEGDAGASDSEYDARQMKRPLALPTVPEAGYQGGLSYRPTKVSLSGRNIQVIVKIANIHLTPENPQYEGGTWHVEGMLNEHIVASGIYYYAEENITESSLAFRTAVIYPDVQNDESASVRTWGFGRSDPCNQELGSVSTVQGRCIAFPNLFQHRVCPFKLVDPSRPGFRKIIVFFLVDPSVPPIPSTSIIPPQQKEWATDTLEDLPRASALFNTLPVEVIDLIDKEADLMSRTEAEQYRLELMDERTTFVTSHDESFFSVGFSMCEH